MSAMASVPPSDPRRDVVAPIGEEPRDRHDAAAPTPMRVGTRRLGTATIAMLIAAILVIALIVLL